jgi:hypothetical protein
MAKHTQVQTVPAGRQFQLTAAIVMPRPALRASHTTPVLRGPAASSSWAGPDRCGSRPGGRAKCRFGRHCQRSGAASGGCCGRCAAQPTVAARRVSMAEGASTYAG